MAPSFTFSSVIITHRRRRRTDWPPHGADWLSTTPPIDKHVSLREKLDRRTQFFLRGIIIQPNAELVLIAEPETYLRRRSILISAGIEIGLLNPPTLLVRCQPILSLLDQSFFAICDVAAHSGNDRHKNK
jgi:hypothetical protein